MNMHYIAPEAKLLRFISAESLATNANIDFDTLLSLSGNGNGGDPTEPSVSDISLPLA